MLITKEIRKCSNGMGIHQVFWQEGNYDPFELGIVHNAGFSKFADFFARVVDGSSIDLSIEEMQAITDFMKNGR